MTILNIPRFPTATRARYAGCGYLGILGDRIIDSTTDVWPPAAPAVIIRLSLRDAVRLSESLTGDSWHERTNL